jgi:hypothetical protein
VLTLALPCWPPVLFERSFLIRFVMRSNVYPDPWLHDALGEWVVGSRRPRLRGFAAGVRRVPAGLLAGGTGRLAAAAAPASHF